jgi:hypothetical protein
MEYAPRNGLRRLAVCYPGDTSFVFMQAFESIVAIESPDDCEVKWFRGVGWCQARRRIHAAQQALDWDADLIACLDLDQVYEPDILKRLVARHDEGCQMVAAMVPMRGYVRSARTAPFQPLAWKIDDGEFVPVDPADGELQRCEFPTSAALLFRASDLRRLKRPWYFFSYKPEDWKQIHGEDASFALRMLRELNVEAWVDTTIRVKHLHPFAIDETFSERFSDWAEEGIGEDAICGYEGTDAT